MGITRKNNGRDVGGYDIETALVSFETGEQAIYRFYFPRPVLITAIKGIVVKAIAGTDAGTITGANSVGASTGGVITCAAADPLNTEYTATPTTNIAVASGSYYQVTTAKTTPGGKVNLTLQYKAN